MNPDIKTRTLGLSQHEVREFSFINAIRGAIDPTRQGIEHEISHAYIEEFGAPPGYRGGLVFPVEEMRGLQQRDLLTSGSAGKLVADELRPQDFIGLLRNATHVLKLGARVLNDLVGNPFIPRQSGAATVSWIGEGIAATESDQSFDQVTLTPKTMAANTKFSRRTVLQATPSIEALVREDLAKVLAIELDRAAINGAGTATEPTGILNTSGVGSITFAADSGNGGAPDWTDVCSFEATLEAANVTDDGTFGWLSTPAARKKLLTTPKIGSTFPNFLLDLDPKGNASLAGRRALFSNNVPADLTKGTGTGLSALLFGKWSDLLIGEWGTLELLVDPYTNSTTGAVVVTVFLTCDISVRHAVSFAAATDFLTT